MSEFYRRRLRQEPFKIAPGVSAANRSYKNSKLRRSDITLRNLLAGGDRRSVAQSNHARAIIEANPERIAELAELVYDDDWLVSLRAMDLLEKFTHDHPDWVQPYRKIFIGPLADSDKWEIRLQIVRALPLLKWTPQQQLRVVEILARDILHPQKFVRAWALDSLATFAVRNRLLMPIVQHALAAFDRSNSKALQTRARKIRKRIANA